MTNLVPKPKKEPYMGDPNATLTICYKKLRRHLPKDLEYVVLPSETPTDIPETQQDKDSHPPVNIAVICKHCKQDPVIYRDDEKQPG